MIERLANIGLTAFFSVCSAFTLGVVGEAIDRGNELGFLLACFVAIGSIAGALFFGRDVLRGYPSVEPILDGAAESDPSLSSRHAPRSDSADLHPPGQVVQGAEAYGSAQPRATARTRGVPE